MTEPVRNVATGGGRVLTVEELRAERDVAVAALTRIMLMCAEVERDTKVPSAQDGYSYEAKIATEPIMEVIYSEEIVRLRFPTTIQALGEADHDG